MVRQALYDVLMRRLAEYLRLLYRRVVRANNTSNPAEMRVAMDIPAEQRLLCRTEAPVGKVSGWDSHDDRLSTTSSWTSCIPPVFYSSIESAFEELGQAQFIVEYRCGRGMICSNSTWPYCSSAPPIHPKTKSSSRPTNCSALGPRNGRTE
jgi:hypothetical protein